MSETNKMNEKNYTNEINVLQKTVFDLNPHYGLIKLAGSDSIKFLQGILTCDMQELANKDHCFGAFCNLKGRVRALFRIFKHKNEIYLLTPKALLPVIIPVLKKHAMFSKIAITDASIDWSILGVVSMDVSLDEDLAPQNTSIILTLNDRDDDKMGMEAFPKMARYIVICDPLVPLNQPDLNNDKPDKIGDFEAWKLLDIRAGIPEVWLETTEKFLPHHLNLPELGAVSFTKGCYCGQEIIARMEYKGKVKYRMERKITRPSTDITPLPGTELETGTVVSSCKTPEDEVEMLVIGNVHINE